MNELVRALTTAAIAVPRLYGPAPVFYSRLQRAAELLPGAIKSDSVINTLKRAPGGVSDTEIAWSDLPQFLTERRGKILTKPELVRYLESHVPGVDVIQDPAKRYRAYALTPTDNYRETLILDETPKLRNEQHYQSPHFDTSNIASHTRTTTRRMFDAGPVPFLDELQSDWHQAGREVGYESDIARKRMAVGKKVRDWNARANAAYEAGEYGDGAKYDLRASKWRIKLERLHNVVPGSPFTNEWQNVGLKEFLHRAAKEGAPGVGWSDGSEISSLVGGDLAGQAAFYDTQVGARLKKLLSTKGANVPTDRKTLLDSLSNVFSKEGSDLLFGSSVRFDQKVLREWAERLDVHPEVVAESALSGNARNLWADMPDAKRFQLAGTTNERLPNGRHASSLLESVLSDIRNRGLRHPQKTVKAEGNYIPLPQSARARIVREGFPLL